MIPSFDDTVALAAAGGDRTALEETLRASLPTIELVCRRILGHPEDAGDAAQEVLLVLARRIDRYDGRAPFAAWLHRVATNVAIGEVRKRRRRFVATRDAESGPRQAPSDPVDEVLAEHLAVLEALTRLSPRLRVPVVLRDVHDLDHATIAAMLGVPEGTVRSRLHRGRRTLRAILEGTDRGPGAVPMGFGGRDQGARRAVVEAL